MGAELRTALVTGASSGIGVAFAHQLGKRKLDLVLTARREDRLQAVAGELSEKYGVQTEVIPLDLAAPTGADDLHRAVTERGLVVDVLVNNAGFGVYGKSWEQDYEKIRTMLEVNMVAVTTLTHRFVPEMIERGRGRILQTASIAAFQPAPLYAVYAATKAYVLSFSVAMNHELRGTGVSITSICPGLTESEFHEVADHLKPPSLESLMMSAEAVARIGIDAMMAGRPVVTPGLPNKLAGGAVKFLPRSWATWVAGKSMESRR